MSVESSFVWTCDNCERAEATVCEHPPDGWATVRLARLRRGPGPGALAFRAQLNALAHQRSAAAAGAREALHQGIIASRDFWEKADPLHFWHFCGQCEPRVLPIEDTATPEEWEAYRAILAALGEDKAHLKVVE